MSAREVVLARVREALEQTAVQPAAAVPRGYRAHSSSGEEVVATFCERVSDYGATVTRCQAGEIRATIAAAVAGVGPIVVPEGFTWPVSGSTTDTGLSAAQLDRTSGVVTEATVAIASTGTLVLTHGKGQGRRALTLVPDLHVCVLLAEQIVANVPDAIARIRPAEPQTWISGPSATSDIELIRVEGVHGPRQLHVIVAG